MKELNYKKFSISITNPVYDMLQEMADEQMESKAVIIRDAIKQMYQSRNMKKQLENGNLQEMIATLSKLAEGNK